MVDPSSESAVTVKQTLDEKLRISLDVSVDAIKTFYFVCTTIKLCLKWFFAQILRTAFKRYRCDEMFISFNGGKDCTVLLHLVEQVIREIRKESGAAEPIEVLCVYLQPQHAFEEIEAFVDECQITYSIRLQKTPSAGKSKQESLFAVCEQTPELKACLMGCRRTDPWCDKLHAFEVSAYK